jgi:hypothetical protein
MNKVNEMYSQYTDYEECYKNVYSDSFFFLQGIYSRQILEYTARYVSKIWVNATKDHLWNTLYKLYCENQYFRKFLYL